MPENEDGYSPQVGDHRESTSDRPGSIFRAGVQWDGPTQRYVDDPERNFWEYSCHSCGEASCEWGAFTLSVYHNDEFVCRCCYDQALHDEGLNCDDPDCEVCNEDNEDNRAWNIHEYNYTPPVQFFRTQAEHRKYQRSSKMDRTPYLSFEIEVENKAHHVSNETAVRDVTYDWNYAKQDGSVPSGFEMVSHPFTFAHFKSGMREEWQAMLKSLSDNGYRSYEEPTCGMHVHISKAAFTNYHLYRFLRVWYFSRRFTFWLSRRNKQTFDMWSGFNRGGPYPIVRKAKDKYFPDKYESINLAHSDSVEVRIFRGTLDVASFQRNVETVYAAFQFSDPYSADKVKTFQITPEGFAKYVKRYKKTFPELYKHFWEHGHVVSEIARETASTAKGEI